MSHPISVLDGRYASKVTELAAIVSEFGLMKYRLVTEVAWLKLLETKGILPKESNVNSLETLVGKFNDVEYEKIKSIEATTKHDVKSVEYYLREYTDEALWPWIHFACTSEDINNIAYAHMMRDARSVVATFLQESIVRTLITQAQGWKDVAMLSHTHGQPATPTTVGKELGVYVERLRMIHERLMSTPIHAKMNGATGNYAAHVVAFPNHDWIQYSKEFVEGLGFVWRPLTTQIESHDHISEVLDHLARVCSVLSDLSTDIWGYISLGYFKQKTVEGEVGSSTMPHKVNPIDFENARGNFKLARGIGRTLSDELPISMWQRDLSDSTLERNLGLVFGHMLVGLKSLKSGLEKIELNEAEIQRDLDEHPEVLTEAIQTVLRKHGQSDAYEKLKELSRGKGITLVDMRDFVLSLSIPEEEKKLLCTLVPATYTGKSSELVSKFV